MPATKIKIPVKIDVHPRTHQHLNLGDECEFGPTKEECTVYFTDATVFGVPQIVLGANDVVSLPVVHDGTTLIFAFSRKKEESWEEAKGNPDEIVVP